MHASCVDDLYSNQCSLVHNRCMVSSVWVFKCGSQYTSCHSYKDVLTTMTSGHTDFLYNLLYQECVGSCVE